MTDLSNVQWNNGYGLEALQKSVQEMKDANVLFFELIERLQTEDEEACQKVQFIRSSFMDKLNAMGGAVTRFMKTLNECEKGGQRGRMKIEELASEIINRPNTFISGQWLLEKVQECLSSEDISRFGDKAIFFNLKRLWLYLFDKEKQNLTGWLGHGDLNLRDVSHLDDSELQELRKSKMGFFEEEGLL